MTMTVSIIKDDTEQVFKNVVSVSGNEGHLRLDFTDNNWKVFDMSEVGYFEIK